MVPIYLGRALVRLVKNESGTEAGAAEPDKIAIKLNPNYYEAYLNKGVAEKALNQINQSIESYKTSNKIDPERYESYFNIGNIYYHLKNYTIGL